MRITTDVNYAGTRPAGNVSSRVFPATASSEQINQLNNDVTARIQRDRAMIDALTIAQSSRVLVQKAMDISARLRAIAYQAMTTGSVRTEEISSEIAGIQETMQTYGEIISVPVSGNRGGEGVPAQIYDRMADVASGAGKLATGEKVDPAIFAGAEKAMSGVLGEIDAGTAAIISTLGHKAKNAADAGGDAVKDTVMMIRKNPELSLTAQANINPEAVKTVIA